MPPCDGRLVRVHLIPKRMLTGDKWHDSLWVWGCGGPTGISGHHGMLDSSRRLRIPRDRVPAELELLAAELELTWWLDREYG